MSTIIACTRALEYCKRDNPDYHPKDVEPRDRYVAIDRAVHHISKRPELDLQVTYVSCSLEEVTSAIDCVDGEPASVVFWDLGGLYGTKNERLKMIELEKRMNNLAQSKHRTQEFNQARGRYLRAIEESFATFSNGEIYRKIFQHLGEGVPVVKYTFCERPLGFLLEDGVLLARDLPLDTFLSMRNLQQDLTPFFETFGIPDPNTGEVVGDMSAYSEFHPPEDLVEKARREEESEKRHREQEAHHRWANKKEFVEALGAANKAMLRL